MDNFANIDASTPYFYLEFSGLKTVQMIHIIKENQEFDFQFGRILACHLLGQPERLNWKACLLDKSQEEQMAD